MGGLWSDFSVSSALFVSEDSETLKLGFTHLSREEQDLSLTIRFLVFIICLVFLFDVSDGFYDVVVSVSETWRINLYPILIDSQ